MRKEIRLAGFGGQGIVTMGTLLAIAAGIYEDLEVAQTQSYGPEARGGACRSDVIISDEPIDYTKPLALDLFVALSPAAIEQYWPEVQEEKTRVITDQTLVLETPKHSPPVLALEATRIAEEEFQNRMMANMILLGAIAAHTGWVRLEALGKALAERIQGQNLEISQKALRRGVDAALIQNQGGRKDPVGSSVSLK